jgi:hypothetical protein
MEDVLEGYHRPYDEQKPVVCMDEQPVQLRGQKREPIPMNEHHERREDNEYVRKERSSLYIRRTLGGRRYVAVSERRTKQDWAREVKSIVLVMDNLNTHTLSSLYEAFPAAEAFEIAQKLEIPYTPKHGSWLNIAEIKLSAMTNQCLNRRIDSLDKLNREVRAWQHERNRNQKTVKWLFTTDDARIKLHSLYPAI